MYRHYAAPWTFVLAAVVGFLALTGEAQAQSLDKVGLTTYEPSRTSSIFTATDVDDLPQTLQDIYSFGEMGPPDLQIRTDAGYQMLLDLAARDVGLSERAEPDDYVLVSHDETDGD